MLHCDHIPALDDGVGRVGLRIGRLLDRAHGHVDRLTPLVDCRFSFPAELADAARSFSLQMPGFPGGVLSPGRYSLARHSSPIVDDLMTSIPGARDLRSYALVGSPLPAQLTAMGYIVEKTCTSERILAHAVAHRFETSSSGALVPATEGLRAHAPWQHRRLPRLTQSHIVLSGDWSVRHRRERQVIRSSIRDGCTIANYRSAANCAVWRPPFIALS